MTSEEKQTLGLDFAAGLVTGVLLLSITLVIFIGNQIGIRVAVQLPADSSLGPFEALTLVFSEPVDGSLAIGRFSIQPDVKGKFEWADSKTLRFIPQEPYQPDVDYTFALAPGPLTNTGGALKKKQSWSFHIRQPLLVYLVVANQKYRLWTIEKDSGKINPLTDDSFDIYDFDASHHGEFVVFSAFNEQKGIDLWRVSRSGGNAVLLLQCGADRCSLPAISPDDRRIAYVREAAAPAAGLPYGSPRIRILDLETRRDSLLYEDQQIIGYGPVWSPDGTRLSSYDGIKDEIRLLDLVTSSNVIVPSQTGSPVTWSSDSSTFVFTDMADNDFGSHARIREAKIAINEITTIFGEKDEWDYAYSSLAWSPSANALVIGLRPNADDPSEALWLMDPGSLDGQVIASQPDYIYSNPRWDPWGKVLVFQQFKLKEAYKPEICLWMPGMQEPRVIAEATLPHWLP